MTISGGMLHLVTRQVSLTVLVNFRNVLLWQQLQNLVVGLSIYYATPTQTWQTVIKPTERV